MNRMIHTSNTARYYDHNVTTFKDVMKIFIIFVIKIDGDKKTSTNVLWIRNCSA